MRKILEFIENQNPLKTTPIIIASVILRGIFEGSFESARNLHFQVSLYKAFLFFFLHQFSFYFAAFLLLTLIIALTSKTQVFRAYNIVATFSFLIIVPPLFDSLFGGGYKLKYILTGDEFWETLKNFFNPFYDLSPLGITYGMRLEITLALLGILIYVLLKTGKLIRGIIAGILSFFVLLFLGSVPHFFVSIFNISPGFAFTSYSLLYEDTQRYSILNLFVIVLALIFFAFLYDKRKALTVLTLRIQKLPFYISMGIVGFVLGYRVGGHLWPHPFKNPFDHVALFGLILALSLSHHFGVLINDINDYEIDRINGKRTSVNGGGLSLYEAKVIAGILFVLASALFLSLGFDTFILGLATLGLAWIYSVDPIRTKRIYLLSTFTLGSISVFCQLIGASLWLKDKVILAYPKEVIFATLIGVSLAFTVKDIEDYKGDKAFGILTNYTLFGMEIGRILSGSFIFLAFFLIPIILDSPITVKLFVWTLGLIAAFLASRKKFYEIPLWLLFFLMLIPISYFYLRKDISSNFSLRRDNPYSEILGLLRGNPELALKEINYYLSIDPCDLRFANLKLLSFLYKNPDSLERFYEKLKGECQIDDRTLLIVGAHYLRVRNFEGAKEMGIKALRVGSVDALAFLELVEDSLKNYDEALRYSNLAKKYKANYPFVYSLLSR
jgi:4-hydroxybenzoate polyprenyltransferase